MAAPDLLVSGQCRSAARGKCRACLPNPLALCCLAHRAVPVGQADGVAAPRAGFRCPDLTEPPEPVALPAGDLEAERIAPSSSLPKKAPVL